MSSEGKELCIRRCIRRHWQDHICLVKPDLHRRIAAVEMGKETSPKSRKGLACVGLACSAARDCSCLESFTESGREELRSHYSC